MFKQSGSLSRAGQRYENNQSIPSGPPEYTYMHSSRLDITKANRRHEARGCLFSPRRVRTRLAASVVSPA